MDQENIFNNSNNKNSSTEQKNSEFKSESTVNKQQQNPSSETPTQVEVKSEQTSSTQEGWSQQDKQNKIKSKDIFAWLGGLIIIGAIFCILVFFCNFQPLWLVALILFNFYLLLFVNYLNKFKIKKLAIIFSLLLLALPIIVLIFVSSWAWWMWLLVIGFYFITLGFYFMGVLLENYWQVSAPLSIFLILMLLFLSK